MRQVDREVRRSDIVSHRDGYVGQRVAGGAPARSVASSVDGLVLVCLLAAMVLLPYAFYGTMKNLQDCTQGANTAVAAADCNSRYGSLESIVGGFLSFGQRAGG